MNHIESHIIAPRPGLKISVRILERISVAGADNEALDKAVGQVTRPWVEFDPIDKEQPAKVEDQVFGIRSMRGEMTVSQIGRIGILVPDKLIVVVESPPTDPSQVEDITEKIGLRQKRCQIDRRVELPRRDVTTGHL